MSAEKLQIANYFFMSAPVGEVDEVITDVKTIVNDDKLLSASKVDEILSAYNVDQMICAANPNNAEEQLMVSSFGRVSANEFTDPNSGKVCTFDHTKREFTGSKSGKSLKSSVESYRSAINKAMSVYVENNFITKKCVVAVYGNDNGTVNVCVAAKNIHLGNCYTGSWRGQYEVNVNSKGSQTITGTTRIQVHYFEDGNVQLHATIESKDTVTIGDADSTAQAVANAIQKFEVEYQNNLEEMYLTMHKETFKSMRRFLPKTRQKMNWNSAAHNMVDQLQS